MNNIELMEILNKIAPFDLSEDFDNTGIIIGEMDSEVKGIITTIDITHEVIEFANSNECNVIISHHPLIFNSIKSITNDLYIKAIKNNITVIALHTNYDSARLNDALAKKIGIKDTKKIIKLSSEGYLGRIGIVEDISYNSFIKLIKEKLKLKYLKTVNEKLGTIRKIAFNTGGLACDLEYIKELNCDVYIAGEIKYNDMVDAYNMGISLIEIGHYESECIFGDDLLEVLYSSIEGMKILNYNRKVYEIR